MSVAASLSAPSRLMVILIPPMTRTSSLRLRKGLLALSWLHVSPLLALIYMIFQSKMGMESYLLSVQGPVCVSIRMPISVKQV